MNELTMEMLKLVASFMTPLIILILGLVINRKLESSRVALSKKKDWQNWWAAKFLDVCNDYSTSITDIVTGLYQIPQIENGKLPGWERELEETVCSVRQSMRRLQYLDWEIQNHIQFTPSHGPSILKWEKVLYNTIACLTEKKQGDLEEIRKLQFGFNKAVMLAHAEILGLTITNFSSEPT
jgi:hypothetical protein